MVKIYRVSGLKSAGSASGLARAISAINSHLKVTVDVEEGQVHVHGPAADAMEDDFLIARAVKDSGCQFLGAEQNSVIKNLK